jgi:hypothetical protein
MGIVIGSDAVFGVLGAGGLLDLCIILSPWELEKHTISIGERPIVISFWFFLPKSFLGLGFRGLGLG